ncbi:MAG: hypothetical protein WBC49_06050 [Thermoplasmata archaeon]
MKKLFEADGWTKHAEEDQYDLGCLPGTGSAFDGSERFKGETLAELFQKIGDFLGMDLTADDYEADSCGQEGRMDIARMEDGMGQQASEYDLARWKEGNKRLWYVTYTFHIEKVTRETVGLPDTLPSN